MTEYPDDADGAVLEHMKSLGVDMNKPLLIEFAVDAPDENAAATIEAALKGAGFLTEIAFDEGEPDEEGNIDPEDEEFGPSWTVFALVKMTPQYEEIVKKQNQIKVLVEPLGGVSDGWGSMIQ